MVRIPKPQVVIHKGRRSSSGVRLVPVPASDRRHRKGSLAERMAALKAATQSVPEDPKLL